MSSTVGFPNYTIENGAIEKLGKLCSKYGEKVLVIGGKTALSKTEEEIKNTLKTNDLEIIDFIWYGGECTLHNIELKRKKAVETEADLIIGVGGGKALDTAKGAAEKADLPIFTVPTIAATCAATTPLSILYTAKGDFDSFFHLTKPPVHIFIDTKVIANAPAKYLRGGIGDTVAKHYEVEIKSRPDELAHASALGKEMSTMCVEPLVEYGFQALKDCRENDVSFALKQVVLNNIITTGLVSMLVKEKYNGACAHSLCYGLTLIERLEEEFLHGELVAYGLLVQLIIDERENEFNKLYHFFDQVGLPVSLDHFKLEVNRKDLESILKEAVAGEDMIDMPYQVTEDDFYEAIKRLEMINKGEEEYGE
ncbi:iron-containing alcohol dehydrogenase family protein [Acetohalobium arabaticum]|uniref:Iron-containing alcohol dehydrogenase n=1 Tax=Acetohalobium arabaticum (strain ATCC 49924 / DSM 5501 / Z-7288) TaxID=574087 RepID=D9QR62_ACEAZ|nr:iron-containing alcohol dehydrogenase family protein [Acetohalobium arabaticum]ADL13003.1 iron-containing alcohol dehydrogenase [Acetohalobium arabaticum DSM 5501]